MKVGKNNKAAMLNSKLPQAFEHKKLRWMLIAHTPRMNHSGVYLVRHPATKDDPIGEVAKFVLVTNMGKDREEFLVRNDKEYSLRYDQVFEKFYKLPLK